MNPAASSGRKGLFLIGLRRSIPIAVGAVALGVSFGVVAGEIGLPPLAAIAMSALVYSGAAQFAAIAVLAQGGSLGAAVAALTLMNSRYLSVGLAFARTLPGGPLRRAIQAQPLTDTALLLSARGDGTFDRWIMFGAGFAQWLGWTSGTIVGTLGGAQLGDPEALGIDAIYPTFFLVILIGELKSRPALAAAAVGAMLALVLVPIAPPGIPVLAASLGALIGLTRVAQVEGMRSS